jgi:single-stranded-DNA-specific exonuclease
MKWLLKPTDPSAVVTLAAALAGQPDLWRGRGLSRADSSSILASLLLRRGITDSDSALRFLVPSLSHLHPPEQMSGLRVAVERIAAAIERKEPILIYGDYDVDGTTAVIILKAAIELCGGSADFHVPHRIREGYDLRDDVIERAAAAGIRLIISVDMGIRAFAPAETAHRLGVDLIVTDHHLPGPDGVPTAFAVLNPNQAGCDYPSKQLCGAGVAFKLAQGLIERLLDGKDQSRLLTSFMKVVAIATIADAVPLTGENRVFVKLGLEALRTAVNPGLKSLLEVAQISPKRAPTPTDVGFRIAPRINAAGRMDIARDVIELFSVKDVVRARELAAKLDKLNSERQDEERRILQQVDARFAEDSALSDAYCIVLDGDGWHRGVIGITATRLVERYHRPALVISCDGDQAFGSGRSIRAFHLLEAIESCRDLFTRYGGHAHACGFAMPAANVPQLRGRLDAFARARLTLADFEPALDCDAELALDQVTPELFQAVHMLEPFGVGNPEPVFAARAVHITAPPRILKQKHVKLKLRAGGKVRGAPAMPPMVSPEEGSPRQELSAMAISVTPRCHPDGAAIRRSEKIAVTAEKLAAESNQPPGTSFEPRTENGALKTGSWRDSIVLDALGWNMAERLQHSPLLAGDAIDVAFTIGLNDHPEYGGLELSLRDFKAVHAGSTELPVVAKVASAVP